MSRLFRWFRGTWFALAFLLGTSLPVVAQTGTGRITGTVTDSSVGGPGGQGSAPAPDPERCPVALARCP